MIEITPERFYAMGILCFSLIALANLGSYFMNLRLYSVFNHVSSIASLVFNVVLVFFFYYLYSSQKIEEDTSEDIEEIMEQIKNESSSIHKGQQN